MRVLRDVDFASCAFHSRPRVEVLRLVSIDGGRALHALRDVAQVIAFVLVSSSGRLLAHLSESIDCYRAVSRLDGDTGCRLQHLERAAEIIVATMRASDFGYLLYRKVSPP